MIVFEIDDLVCSGLKAVLAADGNGFNARLKTLSDAAGEVRGFDAFEIDWSDGSNNFLFGTVPPDLIERSSPLRYPLITIDTGAWENANLVVSDTFSGPLLGIVQLHLSWRTSSATPDFARACSIAAAAVQNTINDRDNQTSWPSGLVYDGRIALQKGQILMAGQNWRRTLTFAVKFRAYIT